MKRNWEFVGCGICFKSFADRVIKDQQTHLSSNHLISLEIAEIWMTIMSRHIERFYPNVKGN